MRRRRKRGAETNTAFNIGAQNWLHWRLPVRVRSSFLCPKCGLEEMKALRNDVSKLMGSVLFWYATLWIFVFEELNNDKILISIGGLRLGGKFKSNIRREILSGWEMHQKEACLHVACMVDSRRAYIFGEETWKGKVHVENLGVDGRIILKLLLQKLLCMAWGGYIWLTTRITGELLRTR
jgi:hypothetical protein